MELEVFLSCLSLVLLSHSVSLIRDDCEMKDNDIYAGSEGFAVKNSPVGRSVNGDYEDVRVESTSIQPNILASSRENEKLHNKESSRQDCLGETAVKASSAKGNIPNVKEAGKSKEKGLKKKKAEGPLSMHPFKATAYENVALEAQDIDPADKQGQMENVWEENANSTVQCNRDGLIYLSLVFDKTKSVKPPPPKLEETAYVSIDPLKTASLEQHDIASS